ncbi:hypothetical protein Ataiwa_39450 [Algoriphagus taiwanensis]|uniref:Lipoprotein n=1 Tax=Algoriphagus taiwanensis TaxID=1445656 RepID=A0ABQ6Q661_9BACT|nr:hypothetical protein Ataiwa_39450 [Algoriphagus taiwanensis]
MKKGLRKTKPLHSTWQILLLVSCSSAELTSSSNLHGILRNFLIKGTNYF